MCLRPHPLIYILLWAVPLVALVNVTIDDQYGDSRSRVLPRYTPADAWTQGQRCANCSLRPGTISVSQAVDRTWHDAMYQPGQPEPAVTLKFHGVAVYVFNIVPESSGGATTLTNLSFTLDQAYAGNFTHIPNRTAFVSYDVPVFTKTSLPDTQHTLDVRATGPNASLILFDYALYSSTTDNSTSTSSTDTARKRAGIIGGAVAGIVGGCVAVALLVFICRRQRRKMRGEKGEGDVIQQADAGLAHVPVLPGAADELRPRPYPPPSNSNVTSDSPSRSAPMTRADAKGRSSSGTGHSTGADIPSQPASNVPTVSETGRSDSSVQEDLASIRQEIARLREQQAVQEDSLPPPYEAPEHLRE